MLSGICQSGHSPQALFALSRIALESLSSRCMVISCCQSFAFTGKKQIKHIHHILLIYLIYNGVKSGMTFHVEASLRTRASAFIYTVDEIIMVPSYRRTTFAVEGYSFVEMFFILEWTLITTTEQAWQFRNICFQLCVKINIAIFNYIHECISWMRG